MIDALTIAQIKEVLLSPGQREAYAEEMAALSKELDRRFAGNDAVPDARFIRQIVVLAQCNLRTWRNKDEMAEGHPDYVALLERAQELNGLRNHVKNLMLARFGEDTPSNRRATFLDVSRSTWHLPLLKALGTEHP